MHNLRRGLFWPKTLICILALLGISGSGWAQGQQVIFSVTGDVPYSSSEVTKFQTQMTNHNKYSPSKFFVHVGDILSGGSACNESVYSTLASSMKTLEVPGYIVPGDNETVDCKSPSSGMNFFLKYFTNFEQNFCSPATEHQSGHPENWAFTMDGVLFVGINLVYGGSSAAKSAADWATQQLQNNGSQVRAAVFFDHYSPASSSTFSTPFRAACASFDKPVLFVHGHGHSWSTSYPFSEKNIFKVQVNKGGSEDPVEVTVTMNTSSPANTFLLKRNPWSSKTVVSRPPCGSSTTPAPNAPNSLVATLSGSSTISLAWNDKSSDEDGFKIERKAGSGSFGEIGTVGADVNTYDDAGLGSGTTYVYRVRAFNTNGNSNYSNQSSATTPGSGGSGGTSSSSNLALNQPVTASSTNTGKPETNAVDGDAKSYWRSGSVSGSKPIAWLRVDLGAALTVAQVNVSWKDNYYAKTYEVQVSDDDVNWTPVASGKGKSGTQTLSFTPTTARYVRLYFMTKNKGNYRVIEFEAYSNPTSAPKRSIETVAETTMPDEFVLEQNYPNPFNPSTQISFGLPQAAHVTIKVYTINGAEVETLVDGQYAAGTHAVTFHAKNLSTGTYFYVMQAGEVRQVRRLMLVK
jgi:F5/8 type C domain/Fibronectin type III domain/Secretion system C-terminal sorting domain/Calcineurin-like phosphoesterase